MWIEAFQSHLMQWQNSHRMLWIKSCPITKQWDVVVKATEVWPGFILHSLFAVHLFTFSTFSTKPSIGCTQGRWGQPEPAGQRRGHALDKSAVWSKEKQPFLLIYGIDSVSNSLRLRGELKNLHWQQLRFQSFSLNKSKSSKILTNYNCDLQVFSFYVLKITSRKSRRILRDVSLIKSCSQKFTGKAYMPKNSTFATFFFF